jgi:hypothetical protein
MKHRAIAIAGCLLAALTLGEPFPSAAQTQETHNQVVNHSHEREKKLARKGGWAVRKEKSALAFSFSGEPQSLHKTRTVTRISPYLSAADPVRPGLIFPTFIDKRVAAPIANKMFECGLIL